MKKIILCIVTICFATSVCVAGDYKSCVIETFKGDTIECVAKINNYFKAIFYKEYPGAKTQKMPGKHVRFATFCEGDSCYIYSGIPIVDIEDAVRGKTKGKFAGFHRFLTDPKSGKFAVSTQTFSNGAWATYVFFFHRPGENYVTWAYYPYSWTRYDMIRNAVKLYMSDCPQVVDYVTRKDTKIEKVDDFIGIVQEYYNCDVE